MSVPIVLVLGLLLLLWVTREIDREMRGRFLAQATAVARQVSQEDIAALSFTQDDPTNARFQRLRFQMMAYAQTAVYSFGPDTKYLGIYSLAQREGAIRFGPESIEEHDPRASVPGTIYERPPAEVLKAFQEGRPQIVGPYTDEYGAFVSAFAPVIPAGSDQTTLVIGMDIEASDWNWRMIRARSMPILLTTVLITILLAGGIVLIWRERLPVERRWRLRHAEAALVAAVGLALTLAGIWLAHDVENRSRREAFAQLADSETARIAEEIRDLYDGKLEGVARLFYSSTQVDREEFRKFTGQIVKDPAVQAWGWIPAVSSRDLTRFEADARKEGLTNYAVWQKDAQGNRVPAQRGKTVYPVCYLEPLADNAPAFGYDLGSEPVRRAALEEAARTGCMTGTDPIVLAQESGDRKGMQVYRPVFTGENPNHLLGFALAALLWENFFEKTTRSTSASNQPAVILDFHFLRAGNPPLFLASTLAEHAKGHEMSNEITSAQGNLIMTPVFAFGKAYAITAHSGTAFAALHPRRAGWFTALVGLLLTAALTVVAKFTVHRRQELELEFEKLKVAMRQPTS